MACLAFPRSSLGLASAEVLGALPKRRGAERFRSLNQPWKVFELIGFLIRLTLSFDDGMLQRGTDLLISVACPFRLKAPFDCAALGVHQYYSSCHASELSGMMPAFWQMFCSETSVGMTVKT